MTTDGTARSPQLSRAMPARQSSEVLIRVHSSMPSLASAPCLSFLLPSAHSLLSLPFRCLLFPHGMRTKCWESVDCQGRERVRQTGSRQRPSPTPHQHSMHQLELFIPVALPVAHNKPKIWAKGLYRTCNWVTLDLKCSLLPCLAWIKLPLLPPYWLPTHKHSPISPDDAEKTHYL